MTATRKAGLLERYDERIVGVLGCYDRVVLAGTLTAIAHPEAMASVLRREHIRCFDLEQYVEPLRQQIRQNAEQIAAEHGLEIEHLQRHDARKEDMVAEILARRGWQPGLVHILVRAGGTKQHGNDRRYVAAPPEFAPNGIQPGMVTQIAGE